MNKVWIDYCRDPINEIEGYELLESGKKVICHHRLETHDKWGNRREEDIPVYILKRLGLYYYRPASELIFITLNEHSALHRNPMKGRKHTEFSKEKNRQSHLGKKHSEESKKKMSMQRLGPNNGMYGRHWTDEERKHISAATIMGMNKKEVTDKISKAVSDKWKDEEYRNKQISSRIGKKASEEVRQRLSNAHKDFIWITNDKEETTQKLFLPIPEGWHKGRLSAGKLMQLVDEYGKRHRVPLGSEIPNGWRRGR